MTKPRRAHASVSVGCVTLYFLLAAALGSITLGILEGPVAVLATCLTIGALLIALSLRPGELTMELKGSVIIVVTLLLPTAMVASPHLSDSVRWALAAAIGCLVPCLLAKVPVGNDQWSEPVELVEFGGNVNARWIIHALWAGRSLWISAILISAAGALWHVAHAHWTKAAIYVATLAGILFVAGLILTGLERWLITRTLDEDAKIKILMS